MLFASMLTLGLAVSSQTVSRYQCWFDSETTDIISGVMPTDSLTVAVPVGGLTPGLHFFNWRGINGNGEPGLLFRTLFYLPSDESADARSDYELWFDSDYASRARFDRNAFEIDLPDDLYGLHFLNLLPRGADGEPGVLLRTLFYVAPKPTADIGGYEYWFDSDEDNSVTVRSSLSNPCFEIDVAHLSEGPHTFNFCPLNGVGHRGEIVSEEFILTGVSAIDSIVKDDETVTVHDLRGVELLRNAKSDMLRSLAPGIYIVNGRKIIIR